MNNTTTTNESTTDVQGVSISPETLLIYNVWIHMMVILGVLENGFVLYVFARHGPLSTTDWYILFITICDFMSSLASASLYACYTNGLWQIIGSSMLCKIHMCFSQSIVFSTVFLTSGLAVERYLAICRPMLAVYSKARSRNSCFIICICSTTLAIPCYFIFSNLNGKCSYNRSVLSSIYYMAMFLLFVSMTIIVVFSYIKVTLATIRSRKNVLQFQLSNKVDQAHKRCWCYFTLCTWSDIYQMSASSDILETSITSTFQPLEICTHQNHWTLGSDSAKDKHHTSHQMPPFRESQQCGIVNDKKYLREMPKPKQPQAPKLASMRTTTIAVMVCTTFIITWIPPWIAFLIPLSPKRRQIVKTYEFSLFGKMTYLINNVLNPVIYIWLNRKFRKYLECCGYKE